MRSIISLRSNITRRKANKTAECTYEHSANCRGFCFTFFLQGSALSTRKLLKKLDQNFYYYLIFIYTKTPHLFRSGE